MISMLMNFWFIFSNIILPIVIQMAVGFIMQKKFKFDLRTLSQVQFLVFIPAMLFIKIYQGDLAGALVWRVIASSIIIYLIMVGTAFATAYSCRMKGGLKNAFANTASLYNSGNYCIPLMQLLYRNDPFVMSVQAVIMTVQNILVCTIGALNASSGRYGVKKALIDVLKLPMMYVALLAVMFKLLHITLWQPVVSTLDIMSSGLVPIALFTLGAQLATTEIDFSDFKVYLSSLIKLVVGPVVAFFIIKLCGITGVAAPVVLIVSSAPTAVNALILSIEFKNEPDFTSHAVFFSTVLSAITVTMVIYFTQIYTGW